MTEGFRRAVTAAAAAAASYTHAPPESARFGSRDRGHPFGSRRSMSSPPIAAPLTQHAPGASPTDDSAAPPGMLSAYRQRQSGCTDSGASGSSQSRDTPPQPICAQLD